MNKFYISLITIVLIFNFTNVDSQNTVDTARFNQKIDPEDFKPELFKEIFLYQYNAYRIKNELDSIKPNDILMKAAEDQATYMASREEKDIYQGGKKKTTGDRVEFYGGSQYAFELINKININKGKTRLRYNDVVDQMLEKWTSNKKARTLLENKNFIFIGVHAANDLSGKKAYVSIVFGNYKSFNKGVEHKDELAFPYTTKKYGLKPYDQRICKKVEQFKNIEELQKGIYVKDELIYFKYNDLKRLKKLISSGGKNGLAVDIVQKEQYVCGQENIIDNNLVNKGILVKRIWMKKMIKKNLIQDKKERKKKIDVVIGKWPKGLDTDGDYEYNLLIIKDKHVCRNINQSYLEKGSLEYNDNTWLLPDTTVVAGMEYKPVAEESDLSFRIPFERNKYDYKKEDIKPFLNALNEPDFVVQTLNIAAYSSIEGNVATNKKLQKRRAESIVQALKDMQGGKNIKKTIQTDDSWEDFKNSVKGTKYENMASMTKSEAQAYIKSQKLTTKLEYLLKDQRYAQLDMHIKYEIEGQKEQAYVVSRFNKAAKNCGDKDKALLIQKYIFNKVINEEYDKEAVFNMVIDSTNAECVGLLMNKLWLEKFVNEDVIDDETCRRIDKYYEMAPKNPYIVFNKYFCEIQNGVYKSMDVIDKMQNKINVLYKTKLSKELVDNLNLEFQFIVMSSVDTTDSPNSLVTESLNRIKEIVNVEDANWQSSLKLAYIFIDHGDYDYSAKLLEPFIYKNKVYDELLFTYISLCSYSTYRMMSNRFVTAMQKAKAADPKRFCNLFKGDKFSIQVLENTIVKEIYCKSCK